MSESSKQVRATINYVRNAPATGAVQLEFCTEAEERSTMETLPGREIGVIDARGLKTSLDREGFQLVTHRSAVDDFEDIELNSDKNSCYMAEMSQLLIEVTRASRVIMLSGAKQRFSELATKQSACLVNARPARYPHADNTDRSSAQQIRMLERGTVGPEMKDYSRIAFYNLWRCVSPPPQDSPLAVCDARTVLPADEVPVIAITEVLGIGEVRHETTSYRYNPAHRWYYFPHMNRDEVIIFKTHDTEEESARRVAHSAFDDPDCPDDVVPRASVEARILALYR
ncbi:MAG: hypothetical protein HRT77_10405 [Halioglobus sp.]|nr:hypothetical protein [Halioglobus sp.]